MIIRKIARPLLATAFVGQGVETLLNIDSGAEAVQPTLSGLQGMPDPVARNVPSNAVAVAGLPGGAPDELALGIDFSCARYPNGDVWCWGLDDLNQLGSADAGGFAPRRVQLMQ